MAKSRFLLVFLVLLFSGCERAIDSTRSVAHSAYDDWLTAGTTRKFDDLLTLVLHTSLTATPIDLTTLKNPIVLPDGYCGGPARQTLYLVRTPPNDQPF